jgi:hypothetical protein
MMFPQLSWETFGRAVHEGAMVYATVVGLAAGGCVLLTLVSRVQRHHQGPDSLTP